MALTRGPVGLLRTIGNTPLVQMTRLLPNCNASLFAKLESFNPGGSAKDRSADTMITDALSDGRIKPTSTLVESSSGNYAVAFAREALLHGLKAICVVDPRTNPSTIAMIKALGAQIDAIDEPDPETGDWLVARLNRVREHVDAGAVWLDQYSNRSAVHAHSQGTMREIAEALGGKVDWVFVATSTTGTIAGCHDYITRNDMPTKLVAVDAEGSVLFGGQRGARLLSGYGAGIVPALSEGVTPHEVCRIADVDAVIGTRALARREGRLAGASAGAVVAAAAKLADQFDDDDCIALIFHDGGLAYADSVFNDDWVAETFGLDAATLEQRVADFARGGA